MSGRIEIILGCMFSGKSSELLRRVSRYKAVNIPTVIINSMLDSRCEDNMIKTHSNQTHKAIKVDKLMSITEDPDFLKMKVIGIDEAQFFPDLIEFVKFAEKYDKIVIIAGLDGDSNREPFGDVLRLIPYAEKVTKLSAFCKICQDGTQAFFTKRVTKCNDKVIVGSEDKFIATCRRHYLMDL